RWDGVEERRRTSTSRAASRRTVNRPASRSAGAIEIPARTIMIRGPSASAISIRATRRSKGTKPSRPLTVTRSPGPASARPSAAAIQARPGGVCASAKTAASLSALRLLAIAPRLKRLADTYIYLDRFVPRTMGEGCRKIEAQGADQGVVAQADARAPEQAGVVGEARRVDVDAFDEGDDADRVGDAIAQLGAELQAGCAADRHPRSIERPRMLKGVAAHRTRATGIKPLVGRQLVPARADDGAKSGESGEDIAAGVVEPLIVAQLQARS